MLATMEQAFDSTWVVLQARYPFRDFERDSELKTALGQELFTLATEGVTDPIELREWALESTLLRYRRNLLMPNALRASRLRAHLRRNPQEVLS
jgi:hypothetical protein